MGNSKSPEIQRFSISPLLTSSILHDYLDFLNLNQGIDPCTQNSCSSLNVILSLISGIGPPADRNDLILVRPEPVTKGHGQVKWWI